MAIAAVAIVVIVIVAAIGVLLISGSGTTEANVSSTPAQMVLRIDDFPSGWQETEPWVIEPPIRACSDYNISAFNTSTPYAAQIECIIVTYPTYERARQVYDEVMENWTTITTTQIDDHFDRCVMYELDRGMYGKARYYDFQEKNVCGGIAILTSLYYNMSESWIDSLLSSVEGRIK